MRTRRNCSADREHLRQKVLAIVDPRSRRQGIVLHDASIRTTWTRRELATLDLLKLRPEEIEAADQATSTRPDRGARTSCRWQQDDHLRLENAILPRRCSEHGGGLASSRRTTSAPRCSASGSASRRAAHSTYQPRCERAGRRAARPRGRSARRVPLEKFSAQQRPTSRPLEFKGSLCGVDHHK